MKYHAALKAGKRYNSGKISVQPIELRITGLKVGELVLHKTSSGHGPPKYMLSLVHKLKGNSLNQIIKVYLASPEYDRYISKRYIGKKKLARMGKDIPF